MPRYVTEATGPAYWASYLINGDSSGLETDEIKRADAWRDFVTEGGLWNVVSTKEGENGEPAEPRFSRHYDLHAGPLAEPGITGGEVVDYVLIKIKR